MQIVQLVALLGFAGPGAGLARIRRLPLGFLLKTILGWAVIAGLIYLVVINRHTIADQLNTLGAKIGVSEAPQVAEGETVRIRHAPDGHFWARVTLNGIERRMLIDSGATVTRDQRRHRTGRRNRLCARHAGSRSRPPMAPSKHARARSRDRPLRPRIGAVSDIGDGLLVMNFLSRPSSGESWRRCLGRCNFLDPRLEQSAGGVERRMCLILRTAESEDRFNIMYIIVLTHE